MNRRLWGVTAVVAILFAAAWVFMRLNETYWERSRDRIQTQIEEVDSLTQPVRPDTPIEKARKRSESMAQRMRSLSGEQTQRTDTVKKVIEEQHLLDSEPPSKK